jgi:hypothetical protein
MKNRRLTILFVIMTLGSSPQVWQQLRNLLSAVQHKAQIKFLSMVLSPRADSDAVETTPTVQAEHLASCKASGFEQVQGKSQAKPNSSPRKMKTQRRASVSSEEQEALALADLAKAEGKLSSLHLNAARSENHLTMQGVDFAPTATVTDRGSIVEVVVLPQIDAIAPTFIDSGNFLKLKKTFEESKVLHQKTRYLIDRHIQPLPSLKADAASTEKEG